MGNDDKQTNKHTIKIPSFRMYRISLLVVLVLLLHYPALVLAFKQRLCVSLTRYLRSLASFSSVFQWQLLSQLLP
jgi:hypothetical protein